jgi:hypothetical protein
MGALPRGSILGRWVLGRKNFAEVDHGKVCTYDTPAVEEVESGAATTGDSTITTPTRLVKDDVWLLCVEAMGGQEPTSITDWTLIESRSDGTGSLDPGAALFWHRYDGVTTPNLTITDPGNHVQGTLLVISGIRRDSSLVAFSATSGDTTTDTSSRGTGLTAETEGRAVWFTTGGDNHGGSTSGWNAPGEITDETHHREAGHTQGNDGSSFVASGNVTPDSAATWPTWAVTNTMEEARIVCVLEAHLQCAYTRVVSDSITLSDAAVVLAGLARSVTDSLALTDVATRVYTGSRTVADALSLADVATRSLGQLRTVTDALGLSDVATRVFAGTRTVTDALGLADVATRVGVYARTVADSLSLADVATKVLAQTRTVTDSLSFTDSAKFLITWPAARISTFIEAATGIITKVFAATEIDTFVEDATDIKSTVELVQPDTRITTYVETATDITTGVE